MNDRVRLVPWAGCVGGWLIGLLVGALTLPSAFASTEIVIYGFEGSLEGWAIPDWAKASSDYVGEACRVSQTVADEGQQALELLTAFPGERWTGVYVERQVEVTDWSPFSRLKLDLYLPAEAPSGLGARVILTVGEQWVWTEMNRTIPLVPGQWTTVTVNLKPGSLDWKFFPDERFRQDVRKLGIRIESNRDPAYRGSVFLDNVRLAE